jgi:hypothetical protein
MGDLTAPRPGWRGRVHLRGVGAWLFAVLRGRAAAEGPRSRRAVGLGRVSIAAVRMMSAQGHTRRPERRPAEGDYHCPCWPNTCLGFGWAIASQTANGDCSSSRTDGPLAGAMGGGSTASPMWMRIRGTEHASEMKATMRMSAQRPRGTSSGNPKFVRYAERPLCDAVLTDATMPRMTGHGRFRAFQPHLTRCRIAGQTAGVEVSDS